MRSGETTYDDNIDEVEQSAQLPLQPDELADIQQQGAVLNELLAKLPQSQSEALLLRHVAGMSLAEIADVTGEKQETVKSRIRYAISFVRKELRVAV